MKKRFELPKSCDHRITTFSGTLVGRIRVTPYKILWSPKGKKGWYAIKLERFAELMQEHGGPEKS